MTKIVLDILKVGKITLKPVKNSGAAVCVGVSAPPVAPPPCFGGGG